jgi:hypothetical protein
MNNVSDAAWLIPSKAVVASSNGVGCVLYTVGPHVANDLENIGSDLSDIGLDNAPDGISVWEGITAGDSHDSWLEGKFRAPTEVEWASIRHGHCPWDEAPWRNAKEKT